MRRRICLTILLACILLGTMLQSARNVHATVPLETSASWMTLGNYDSYDVALGDLDNDGDLDLASYGESNVHVYCNENGDLNVTACWTSTDATGSSGRVLWADIDKDNYPELFTSLGVYDNNAGVLSSTAVWTNLSTVTAFTIGDVDGDTYLDLVTGKTDRIDLFLNAAGVIDDVSDWNTTEDSAPKALALGDMDNDNYLELAVGNNLKPIRIYENAGGTLINMSMWNSTLTDYVGCLTWGDINGDHFPELYACTQPSFGGDPNRMYMNSGGLLEATPSWNSTSTSYATEAAFADLQGDGDLDLIVSNLPYMMITTYVNGTEMVYLNEVGVIDETRDWESSYQDSSHGLAVGLVNGDTYLDLVVASREDLLQTYRGRVLMYMGQPPNHAPQITGVSADPSQPDINQEVTITVTATDADSDTLTYNFSVDTGNGTIVSETGSSAVWRAPDQEKNCTINITVSDGKGGFAYRDFLIHVRSPPTKTDGPLLDPFMLLLLIIILVIVILIVIGVVLRKKRRREEYPPPPPPENIP